MFSTFIAQWESAHANALQLLGKFAAQTTGAAGTTGGPAWRAFAHTALQAGHRYMDACQAATDSLWRAQIERLAPGSSAAAIKELAALNADLATRFTQSHLQHAGAMADAAAQCLDDLGRTRGPADAAMALGRFAGDVHAQARAQALHVASLANGVAPALAQWADRNLRDGDAAPAREQA
ncbi:hypothetical protein K6W16_01315 [Burkholderia dolosa]|jgi:hypothetical protein|uniref:Phasin protein n=1 Tax=Burkholderia dolosa TaxID=152500 RepID=A0A892I3I1_9BURK|nr:MULTISPECIES: hypothetical protein [Burkholderia]AKE06263.1 hypothetical protein XM57_27375 [Burkholderia cepacia]AJY09526.1 hypothetical protein AK34_3614 [Burkholderia dolosa AU0158]AYZ95048.1 hypothetical protein EGY28_08395 [Burkholderia dolosa]ETP62889.1 hypothetical protein BDSB_21580 [Burkholderia dolosa PC543]MBR8299201.1 hypothetical protein [Burkholderia dolosa]